MCSKEMKIYMGPCSISCTLIGAKHEISTWFNSSMGIYMTILKDYRLVVRNRPTRLESIEVRSFLTSKIPVAHFYNFILDDPSRAYYKVDNFENLK